MKDSEKSKKKSKKWLIAIVLVVIIVAIFLAFYKGVIPTGLMAGNENTEATEGAATPASGPTVTPTGNEIISKNVVDASLPYYEAMDLEPGKYSLEVNADDPIWIRMYSKVIFDDWQNTGIHGYVLAGTNLGENDKVKNYNGIFVVYLDSGSKFYLLILGNKTTINFKITQLLKLQ